MASVSTNVYRQHTPLHQILCDGWMRGFHFEQTLNEASNAGYARCVVEPMLDKEWVRLDAELATWESKCTARPSFEEADLLSL